MTFARALFVTSLLRHFSLVTSYTNVGMCDVQPSTKAQFGAPALKATFDPIHIHIRYVVMGMTYIVGVEEHVFSYRYPCETTMYVKTAVVDVPDKYLGYLNKLDITAETFTCANVGQRGAKLPPPTGRLYRIAQSYSRLWDVPSYTKTEWHTGNRAVVAINFPSFSDHVTRQVECISGRKYGDISLNISAQFYIEFIGCPCGVYGTQCNTPCPCTGHSVRCHTFMGLPCVCQTGYTGRYCDFLTSSTKTNNSTIAGSPCMVRTPDPIPTGQSNSLTQQTTLTVVILRLTMLCFSVIQDLVS